MGDKNNDEMVEAKSISNGGAEPKDLKFKCLEDMDPEFISAILENFKGLNCDVCCKGVGCMDKKRNLVFCTVDCLRKFETRGVSSPDTAATQAPVTVLVGKTLAQGSTKDFPVSCSLNDIVGSKLDSGVVDGKSSTMIPPKANPRSSLGQVTMAVKTAPLPPKQCTLMPDAGHIKLNSEVGWVEANIGDFLTELRFTTEGPHLFYAQTIASAKIADEIRFKIKAVLDDDFLDRLELSEVKVGILVVAPLEGNCGYARAEVVEIEKEAPLEMKVFFIDYGGNTVVKAEECFIPLAKLAAFPRMSILGVWDVGISGEKSIKELSELLEDRSIPMKFRVEKKIGEGQFLVSSDRCKSESVFSLKAGSGGTNLNANVVPFKNASVSEDTTEHGPKLVKPGSTPMTVRVAVPDVKKTEQRKMFTNMTYSPNLVNNAIVLITFVVDTCHLLVMANEDTDNLMNLKQLVDECAKKGVPAMRPFMKNQLVVAPYEGDFYRARIVEINDDSSDSCTVEFIDYGDERKVASVHMFEPTEDIMSCCVFGCKVKLENVPFMAKGVIDMKEIQEDLLFSVWMMQVVVKCSVPSNHSWKVRLSKEGRDVSKELEALVKKSGLAGDKGAST